MHHIGVHGIDVGRHGAVAGDTLVYVFGEIDVRCHLGRIANSSNMRVEHIVKPTVMLYCVAIREIHDRVGAAKSAVSCIVPPSAKGDAPTVPFHGTLAERVEITRLTNRMLAEECQRRGLIFLDFYDHYALPDGSLDHDKSDGLVHIAEKCYGPVRETCERML